MKILGSEITPYNLYINRRKFIKKVSAVGFVSIIPTEIYSKHIGESDDYNMFLDEGDILNTYEEITNYNNFYEFGMGKSDPAENSKNFNSKPWSIKIEGLVNKPQILDLEKLLSQKQLLSLIGTMEMRFLQYNPYLYLPFLVKQIN